MKFLAIPIAALLLVGCAKNIDTPEAVKQGIISDISKKIDVQNMDLSVDAVSFREKEATATVSFRPKGGDKAQSIVMTYTMERQGDVWHVKGRNMQAHEQVKPGAGTAGPIDPNAPMPAGHPTVGGGGTSIPMPLPGTMPAGSMSTGHAPMGSSGGSQPGAPLPAGHPTVGQ